MKDEDLFSHDEAAPSASNQERGGESDRSVLSPASPVSQEAPPPAHPPQTQRWLTARHHLRLLLVVVVLGALASGYGVFRALSPPVRQATSAFQQAPCPFAVGAGLVEGRTVRCGFLTVPEDHSQPQGRTIRLAVMLQNAADVHELIRALGYRQVNLEGFSFGTRLALTVMRLYPADLRSVVLNSVIPPQVNFFTSIPRAAARAFDVLFQRCAADSACNATYPHLRTVFYQLVADLNTTPITFQATSLSGKSVTVHFTGNDLVLWLRGSLYSTALIPELPAVLFHLRQHDYTQLASISGNPIDTTFSFGLFYSIVCGEDMAYTTQHALEASVQGLPPAIRPALLDSGLSSFSICQFWGMKPVPAVQKEPVRSSIPTLILQGEYDPVTPPANGMLAAQTLGKSYFFLFPGVGHGVQSPSSTCPNDLTKAFWENPTEKPDASCISSMPEPVFL